MSLDAAAYQRAAARFGETIVELADEEWELTTHPDDWTVITTVAWVVVGDAQLSAAAAGEALRSVGEFDAAVLGGNPVAAWRGTVCVSKLYERCLLPKSCGVASSAWYFLSRRNKLSTYEAPAGMPPPPNGSAFARCCAAMGCRLAVLRLYFGGDGEE